MTEIYFIKELWIIIKDFLINYKIHHAIKNNINIYRIQDRLGPIYTRFFYFPPPKNTSEIPEDFKHLTDKPKPGLELTTICWERKNPITLVGGWWGGYGWKDYKTNQYEYYFLDL